MCVSYCFAEFSYFKSLLHSQTTRQTQTQTPAVTKLLSTEGDYGPAGLTQKPALSYLHRRWQQLDWGTDKTQILSISFLAPNVFTSCKNNIQFHKTHEHTRTDKIPYMNFQGKRMKDMNKSTSDGHLRNGKSTVKLCHVNIDLLTAVRARGNILEATEGCWCV